MTKSFGEVEVEYGKKYGKLFGVYSGYDPQLVIMDNQLIKNVMIKDFHCFVNRQHINVLHEMLSNNLVMAENEQWRRMRAITSPSFTSGKLRGMVSMMEKCIDKLVDYLDEMIQKQNGVINVRKVTTGFTMDVIASTSFATETIDYDEKNSGNVFVENGKRLLEISMFRILAIVLLPVPILKLLGIRTFNNPKSFEFFVKLSKEIVRQRKTQKFHRNDLMQLMIDAYADENQLNNKDFQHLSSSMNNGIKPFNFNL